MGYPVILNYWCALLFKKIYDYYTNVLTIVFRVAPFCRVFLNFCCILSLRECLIRWNTIESMVPKLAMMSFFLSLWLLKVIYCFWCHAVLLLASDLQRVNSILSFYLMEKPL